MKPKQSPVIREKKQTPTVALSGSGVAEADRSGRSWPGSDKPHEPVDIHARIANRAYELYERGGCQATPFITGSRRSGRSGEAESQ